MELSATCGIYRLAAHHLPALRRHAESPHIAATARVPDRCADGAEPFFQRAERQRAAGMGHVFALEDDGAFRGLVGLHDVTASEAQAGFWGEPFQGRGYATFALTWLLPYAFRNLRLAVVRAEALVDDAASLRVLAKCGFRRDGERAHGEAMGGRRAAAAALAHGGAMARAPRRPGGREAHGWRVELTTTSPRHTLAH